MLMQIGNNIVFDALAFSNAYMPSNCVSPPSLPSRVRKLAVPPRKVIFGGGIVPDEGLSKMQTWFLNLHFGNLRFKDQIMWQQHTTAATLSDLFSQVTP